jgi:hypothetical protein
VIIPGVPGSWDEGGISKPTVVYEDGLYRMWYSGADAMNDNRIGHATSPDGVVWTKHPSNPVLDHGPFGSWDDEEVIHPTVIYVGGLYRMWYNGHDGLAQRILHATSPDGITWTRFTAFPMLEPGSPGSWDESGLGPLCVVVNGAYYHMWYTGWNGSDEFSIGYAWSSDGLTWIKNSPYNPVLIAGSPGSWDDAMVAMPSVLREGGEFRMWYGGTDGVLFQTGHATSPDVTGVPVTPTATSQVWLYQSAPNPFHSSTTIRYHVVVPTRIRLEIVDPAGRVVRRLLSGEEVGAGVHMVKWDGRDDKGRKMYSGLYFSRLEAGGRSQVRNLILIR